MAKATSKEDDFLETIFAPYRQRMRGPMPENEANQLREKINKALQFLHYQQREVIKLRYGVGDGYAYSLEEVSRIFKTTPERVNQIEAASIKRLKRPDAQKALEELAENPATE